MSCSRRDLCPSSRAELSLLSPGWIVRPQLRGAGWTSREGSGGGEAPQAIRQLEGEAATRCGNEVFITTKQRYRGGREEASL